MRITKAELKQTSLSQDVTCSVAVSFSIIEATKFIDYYDHDERKVLEARLLLKVKQAIENVLRR